MNSRLPPAWSKHIKPGPAPKPNLPTVNSLSRAQADEALLKQAYALQQAKRLKEAQDLCLRVLSRTPNHPVALTNDRTGDRAVRQLSPSVVAQMTRFGLTQKALVDHQPRRNRLFPAESGDRRTESREGLESMELPRTAAPGKAAALYALIFPYNDAGLLIVPALFFIQRRNGEVAEWSKALPC
ncbi:hypothetical protein [Mesorhizobium sp. NZP2077]|uniref:hypothetical protein n=1 Tax=Mesorhizobium sp. NZP2077 TaxID=2483404 RepID=UPI0032B1288F